MNIDVCSNHPNHPSAGTSHDALLSFQLLSPEKLRATEAINIYRARSLAEQIKSQGVWSVPLLIEKNHFIVMDGHHRLWSALQLGLQQVPCFLTDYDNPHLRLTSWAGQKELTPEDVMTAGLTGELLAYKTTRHLLLKTIDIPHYTIADLQQGLTHD